MKAAYFKYKPHYKDTLKLAIPVVISQVGHISVHLSDSIVVGHFVGTVALAAVSLVGSIFIVPMLIGMGISYGLTPLISQENGRSNYAECGRLLSNSFIINLITGAILFLIMYFGSVYVLDHLKQSPEVVAQAKPFLVLLGFSIIPLLIFNTFKQFAEGLGFTKQAMQISIWGNVINICLGIIFVRGMFGIEPMGIKGVGYSTLIDRCLMAIAMSFYVFRSKRFKEYLKGFVFGKIDKIRCINILKIGIPVALQGTFEVGAFGGANILIGTIGATQQAAHQVAINMAAVTFMVATGISSAAAIRSGNNFGAKNHQLLRMSALSSYHIVLAFMTFTAIVFVIANKWLPWIVTNDTNVIAVASQLLLFAAVFQVFDGAQVVGLGILRGMGDVNIPTVITLIAYWIIGLPIGYFAGIYLGYGANGIWVGLVCGLAAAAIMLYFRFNKISRKLLVTY
ncbi:MATE family efflux transporter [Mucilaginibacter limnophilus]|uniref:Multidrug-efflux transporter n=1 Tax=Mucilaginibacter limnophilus TaxID=1932778 RepID=A0A437MTF9_9SPHI|nr:MATE family efflux transporter [Mucilaginibacter limnophilus]RVU00945.1 MATE family efflux transporter [Mucilaginibacter limnophilus]